MVRGSVPLIATSLPIGAEDLLWKYLQIKKRFRDSMKDKDVNLSGLIRFEVNGSELRKNIRSAGRHTLWPRSTQR